MAWSKLPEFPTDSCGLDCESKNAQSISESLDHLNSPTPEVCQPPSVIPPVPDAILGARELMAQIYGSCDVLKLPTTDRFIPEIQPHPKQPYLHWAKHSTCVNPTACKSHQKNGKFKTDLCLKASCTSVLHPPMYLMGGKISAKQPTSNYAIHPGGVSGIDCSGFVSVAMAMRGLRMVPQQSTNVKLMGSANLVGLGAQKPVGNPVDCFDRQHFARGVASGDLIVQGSDHVLMVDTVGPDPLGYEDFVEKSSIQDLQAVFQKAKPGSASQQNLLISQIFSGQAQKSMDDQVRVLVSFAETVCDEQVDYLKFKFTIIHSSSANQRIGVQRQHAVHGMHLPFRSFMEEKAVQECIQALKQKWQKDLLDPALMTMVQKYKTADMKQYDKSLAVKLLRHRSDAPGCKGDPFRLQSSHCSACCDLKSTYDGIHPEVLE
jgi:hypothetical protein